MEKQIRTDQTPKIVFDTFAQPLEKQEIAAASRIPVWLLMLASRLSFAILLVVAFCGFFATAAQPILGDGVVVLGLTVFVACIMLMGFKQRYKAIQAAIYLQRFAAANKFSFKTGHKTIPYSGLIFDNGHNREILCELEGYYSALPFSLGNYKFTTGSGKNQQTHYYGYVRIALSRRLPHMVLDSRKNNFWQFSNLPDMFGGDQKLALEGDFNEYFDLYCPKEYERDALYIFTPDLMALLIDHGNNYDIEVVDDQLFLYSHKHFNLANAEALKAIFSLINLIGKSFESRSDYYADELIGDRTANLVAPQGRRLKESIIPAVHCCYYLHSLRA